MFLAKEHGVFMVACTYDALEDASSQLRWILASPDAKAGRRKRPIRHWQKGSRPEAFPDVVRRTVVSDGWLGLCVGGAPTATQTWQTQTRIVNLVSVVDARKPPTSSSTVSHVCFLAPSVVRGTKPRTPLLRRRMRCRPAHSLSPGPRRRRRGISRKRSGSGRSMPGTLARSCKHDPARRQSMRRLNLTGPGSSGAEAPGRRTGGSGRTGRTAWGKTKHRAVTFAKFVGPGFMISVAYSESVSAPSKTARR